MDQNKHKERHIELHKSFDELLADFIYNTKLEALLTVPIKDLVDWSYLQSCNPDHHEP